MPKIEQTIADVNVRAVYEAAAGKSLPRYIKSNTAERKATRN
jgi:hypothetical protein